MKISGSKKLNAACPAKIEVKKYENGSCNVMYMKCHLGHDPACSAKELRHIFMHKSTHKEIASKIQQGVPLPRLISDFQNSDIIDNPNVKFTRINLLNNKDLHSVETSYNVKAGEKEPRPFGNDDHENVEFFLEKHKSSILSYKRQNETCSDKPLEDSDLVLVFMSKTQEEMLKKYGNNVICMDGTHGMGARKIVRQYNEEIVHDGFSEVNICEDSKGYKFLLQTLLVLDEDNEGIPVAFALSNRNDTVLVDVFLTCIKEKVGSLNPRTLMSDMAETYYNSWMKVMGMPQF